MDEIKALGGDEQDFALIADVESDEETTAASGAVSDSKVILLDWIIFELYSLRLKKLNNRINLIA
jgi:hypothetical protein